MKKIIFGLFTFIFSFILINNVNAETKVIDRSTDTNFNEVYDYYYNNSEHLTDLNNQVSTLMSSCGHSDIYNSNKKFITVEYSSVTSSYIFRYYLVNNDYVFRSFKWDRYSSYNDYDFIVPKSYDNNNNVVYMSYDYSFNLFYDFETKKITSTSCNGGWFSTSGSTRMYLSNNAPFIYSDVPITIDYTGSPYDSVNYFGNLITDNVIFYKDVIGGSKMPIYYTVKFNIPNGASLELKNSKGNIVSSSSDNTFSLESGKYTYSVTKSNLYISKENIELVVNEDMEINVELESKLNLTNYSNIFSKFYSYLGSVVPIMFGIEKPFFLIVLGVSMVIIIVLLIKKLLKGRF